MFFVTGRCRKKINAALNALANAKAKNSEKNPVYPSAEVHKFKKFHIKNLHSLLILPQPIFSVFLNGAEISA